MNLSRKTRKVIDLKTKREIIALAEQGLPHRVVADAFNLGRSTVTKILLSKAKVLENDLGIPSNSVKRIRGGKIGALENSLVRWCIGKSDSPESENTFQSYLEYNEENLTRIRDGITQNDILKKAKELAKELGIDSFDVSYIWLKKFQDRFKLDFDINNFESTLDSKEYSLNHNSNNIFTQTPILKSNVPSQIPYSLLLPYCYSYTNINLEHINFATLQGNIYLHNITDTFDNTKEQNLVNYNAQLNNFFPNRPIYLNNQNSAFYW